MDAYFEWKLAVEQASTFVLLLLFVTMLGVVALVKSYNMFRNWWNRTFPYMRHLSSSKEVYTIGAHFYEGPFYPWMMKWENRRLVPLCPWDEAPLWMRIVAKKYK